MLRALKNFRSLYGTSSISHISKLASKVSVPVNRACLPSPKDTDLVVLQLLKKYVLKEQKIDINNANILGDIIGDKILRTRISQTQIEILRGQGNSNRNPKIMYSRLRNFCEKESKPCKFHRSISF